MSTARIERHRIEAPDPLGFDALRDLGIGWVQEASGQLWTDYNQHDPGVTLLEALCYALTEDVYQARQPVPALLQLDETAPDAAWSRLGLHRREDLLPCHPVTEQDWQLWLRRHLPDARQLRMHAVRPESNGYGIRGLWDLRLQASEEIASSAAELCRRALRLFWQQRPLGEDLVAPPQRLAPRWVRLNLRLEISGDRDVHDLLAEVLQRCDDFMSGRFSGLTAASSAPTESARTSAHTRSDEAEGPLPGGMLDAERHWLHNRRQGVLHASDLARQLSGIEGLEGVESLSLQVLDLQTGSVGLPCASLPRQGVDWALRLRWPDTPADLQGWQLRRQGSPIRLHPHDLLHDLNEQRGVLALRRNAVPAGGLDRESGGRLSERPELPVLRQDHLPASALLPALYQEAVQRQHRSQPGLAEQWTGYLALLEQGFRQVQVQREQLPWLYALDQDSLRSSWPGLPGDAQLPGLEALLEHPLEVLQTLEVFDEDGLSRRNRLLDYQLGLHGEALDHEALQGLPCYFDPPAWQLHRLDLKRRFAQRLLRLSRDRAAGADYSRPLLGEPDNTPPLQERVALRLALLQTQSRCLSTEAAEEGAASALSAPTEAALWPELEALVNGADGVRLRPDEVASGSGVPVTSLAPLLNRLGGGTEWLRAAVYPRAFRFDAHSGILCLLDEQQQQGWCLAEAQSTSAALTHARELHRYACAVQARAEGFHLVETLMLRPLGAVHRSGDPGNGKSTRSETDLIWVATGWTARGSDERFRQLAEQIALRETPAQLRGRWLWLDREAMAGFEARWTRWLDLRRQYAQALLGELLGSGSLDELIGLLDQASADLRQVLAQAEVTGAAA
jgi:hypothetical protein